MQSPHAVLTGRAAPLLPPHKERRLEGKRKRDAARLHVGAQLGLPGRAVRLQQLIRLCQRGAEHAADPAKDGVQLLLPQQRRQHAAQDAQLLGARGGKG